MIWIELNFRTEKHRKKIKFKEKVVNWKKGGGGSMKSCNNNYNKMGDTQQKINGIKNTVKPGFWYWEFVYLLLFIVDVDLNQ